MDNWNPIDSALGRLGFDPTGVRDSGQSWLGSNSGDPTGVRSGTLGMGGDPTGLDQWQYGFGGVDPLLDIGIPSMGVPDPAENMWGAGNAVQGGQAGTSLGGDWGGVDQWNATITQAAAKYGVPANLIKAVMMRESGGQNLGINGSMAVGPMQVTTNNWSGLGYDLYDPNQNIMAGAAVLKQMYDSMGTWEGAVRAYLAGPGGAYSNATDSFGTDPTSYWNDVSQYWNQLNNGGASAGMGYNPGGGDIVKDMFGSYVPDWGEFGADSDNGFYDYGTQYGLNGRQHTGVDVPMSVGTAYRAPASGTVMCAGTGIGSGTNGGGCSAFGDPIGGGVGRVEVLLDNGVVLIFGHSQSSALQPGQRFNAGAVLGTSGGMVSPHIHLEARVRDASMPSGWRIVDPRTVLGGTNIGQWSSAGSGQQTQQSPYGGMDMITYFLTTPGARNG